MGKKNCESTGTLNVEAVPQEQTPQGIAISPPKLGRLFDPVLAWTRLTLVQQQQIGTAAICQALGHLRSSETDDDLVDGAVDSAGSIGWEAAEFSGLKALVFHVFRALDPDVVATLPLPNLAAIGVRACRVCGCTDDRGCPDGCWWVSPTLCSSCAPALAQAAAQLPPAVLACVTRDKGIARDDDPALEAALQSGLVEIYSGQAGRSAWAATDYAKLLRDAARPAGEVAAHE